MIWKGLTNLKKELSDHKILVQYLLGELGEMERSEIAARYFQDDDLFEELLEVESELIDRCIRGSLNEQDQQALMRYLASLPGGQEKLALARALIQGTDEERERAQQFLDGYVPASVPRSQSMLKSPSKLSPTLQYAIVTGLVAMILGALFLVFQVRQLRRDNDELRGQLGNLEREKQSLEVQSKAGSERMRQLEEEIKLEQQANEAQAQHLASLQPTMPVVASWTLTPAVRSPGNPDKVTLPHSARFVSITLPVENARQASRLRAIIQTTVGAQRREITGVRANKTGEAVSLKLPAGYFTEKSYKLTLVRIDEDNVELSQDFYFTVSRR
jgi:hypothetical protein